jgi:hypothetical protein
MSCVDFSSTTDLSAVRSIQKVPARKRAKKPILSSEFRDRFQVDLIDMRRMKKWDVYGQMQLDYVFSAMKHCMLCDLEAPHLCDPDKPKSMKFGGSRNTRMSIKGYKLMVGIHE